MKKIKITSMNLQCWVGTISWYWEYVHFWKYVFSLSTFHLEKSVNFLSQQSIDIAFCNEISDKHRGKAFLSQLDYLQVASWIKNSAFFVTHLIGKKSKEGNAFLSQFPIIKNVSHPLKSSKIKRILGESIVDIEGRRVHLFVVHLSLGVQIRNEQIQEIIQTISATKDPVILWGDFNTHVLHEIAQHTRLRSCWNFNTFPSWNPKKCLDHIFVSEEFTVHEACTYNELLFSDHLPLVAVVSLPD